MSQLDIKKRHTSGVGASTTMELPSATSTAKGGRRTFTYHEVSEWQRDNKYILSGYRREKADYLEILTSLTYLHNETCNVYTHLIGALLLPLIAATVMRSLSQPQFSFVLGTDYLMFSIFFWSAECCLLLSTAFHLLGAHSQSVEQFWHRMDLLGIVIVVMGTFIPGIYYIFFCELSLQRFHWFIVILSGSSTAALICIPVFRTLRWRKVKIGAYVALGASALVPLLHGSQLYGLEYMIQYSGMNWYLLELAVYGSGTAFYAFRIPERFAPAVSLLALVGAIYAEMAPDDGADAWSFLTISTTNGPVTGHAASNSQSVIEYLGIPYAKPPVGDLRFAPPERFSDSKPYEAAHFGYDCPLTPSPPVDYPGFTPQGPRILSYFASGAGTNKSEDCLTLNIWAKTTAASHQSRKPVIVFFYGGRFAIGNTNSPFYNAKYFADAQDAIFVTVNYRVNIFGFPGFPGKPQNAGLRDQRAAVEWLHDNVHAFGGDADKITIAGQSSGGVSVDYWTYAYQQRPLINGVIATSGNAFSFPVQPKGVPLESFKQVAKKLGCCSKKNVYECVQKADWREVEAAAASIKPGKSSSPLRSVPPFYPIPDEEIVFSDYVKRTREGHFAKVPLFSGHNNNEAGYYKIPAYSKGVVPTQAQVDAFHLESFTCPIAYQTKAREQHSVPAWVWRYFGDWDNTRLYPTSGAYHGTDLHMIYGASGDVSGIPPVADQEKLTRVMQRAWYAFSDDPWHGLSDTMDWPRYDENKESLIVFGKDNKPEPVLVKPSEFNAPCSTITLGALGTQTPEST